MRSASRAKSSSVVLPSIAGACASGPAVLAFAVNLHDALARGEVARGGDLLDERLDVGAEELGRLVAGLADQMKVPRVPVRVLEPEAALAEVDLARDARVDHPLQRAVDRGAADALVLAARDVEEIVGAEVPSCLRNTLRMRSRLLDRLPPAGRSRSMSGMVVLMRVTQRVTAAKRQPAATRRVDGHRPRR